MEEMRADKERHARNGDAAIAEPRPVYMWNTYQIRGGLGDYGPSGTCTHETTARVCLEAAIRAVTCTRGVFAWGQLDHGTTSDELPFHLSPRDPVAWAVLTPDGRISWSPGLAPYTI